MISARSAESPIEKVWTKNASVCESTETVETGGKLEPFSAGRLTTFAECDWYTFETFASESDEIHTDYYYHYKRKRLVLKEKHPWS